MTISRRLSRERAAAFAPVEGRPAENGDFVQLKLMGTPVANRCRPTALLCHIGAEETMEPFNENLRGANGGDHKNSTSNTPPITHASSPASRHYAVEVLGIKNKKLPELNDEFAKDVSDATTLDELKTKVRESLSAARDQKQQRPAAREGLGRHRQAPRLPVPNRSWSIKWMSASTRCRSLAAKVSIRVP